jgi:hypothetical protein
LGEPQHVRCLAWVREFDVPVTDRVAVGGEGAAEHVDDPFLLGDRRGRISQGAGIRLERLRGQVHADVRGGEAASLPPLDFDLLKSPMDGRVVVARSSQPLRSISVRRRSMVV